MNVGTISNDVVYPHMPSDENMLAGTYPTDTTKGMVLENGVNIRTSSSDMVYGHLPSSEEQEAGTYPENTTVGISYEDKITIIKKRSFSAITVCSHSERSISKLNPTMVSFPLYTNLVHIFVFPFVN